MRKYPFYIAILIIALGMMAGCMSTSPRPYDVSAEVKYQSQADFRRECARAFITWDRHCMKLGLVSGEQCNDDMVNLLMKLEVKRIPSLDTPSLSMMRHHIVDNKQYFGLMSSDLDDLDTNQKVAYAYFCYATGQVLPVDQLMLFPAAPSNGRLTPIPSPPLPK